MLLRWISHGFLVGFNIIFLVFCDSYRDISRLKDDIVLSALIRYSVDSL